jgi:hypothetical protein
LVYKSKVISELDTVETNRIVWFIDLFSTININSQNLIWYLFNLMHTPVCILC